MGKTTLLDGCIVGGGGGDSLECLRNWEDAKATVDGDEAEPCHHGNTAVLELCLAEEINWGKVREAEGVEASISYISLAVWWGLEEGKGCGLGVQGGAGLGDGGGGKGGC